ncbi:MAG: thymidylate synthase [Chromatiales bacterium 21-64-14]|nr:MAG: thymidylate synthase [Chromatiales bacterium 21-64-14]
MRPYLNLLRDVLDNGVDREDRTGTGARSVFGRQMRFALSEGFPAVTTKKLHLKSVIHELLWFLHGETNIGYLRENGVTIWNEWADANGDLGPVYGAQWRAWPTADGQAVDQIASMVHQLRTNPDSRRMVVSAWNAGALEQMALMPCHVLFQAYSAPMSHADRCAWLDHNRNQSLLGSQDVDFQSRVLDVERVPRRVLSLQVYIRSNDLFLGCPFNIASYALLAMMLAQVTDHAVGDLVYTIGDAHIYHNHFAQVRTQVTREPYPLPQMRLNPLVREIDAFGYDDFALLGYRHHPAIRGQVAV